MQEWMGLTHYDIYTNADTDNIITLILKVFVFN